jgi:hypothetical protein
VHLSTPPLRYIGGMGVKYQWSLTLALNVNEKSAFNSYHFTDCTVQTCS